MDDDNKVVSINEKEFSVPGVQEDVVDLLTDLLEQAERGEIVGVVIGAVKANQMVGALVAHGSSTYSALVAASALSTFDLCNSWSTK